MRLEEFCFDAIGAGRSSEETSSLPSNFIQLAHSRSKVSDAHPTSELERPRTTCSFGAGDSLSKLHSLADSNRESA
jgi:hypothetical protein